MVFVIPPPADKKLSSIQLLSYFEKILSSANVKNPFFLLNKPNEFCNNEINPDIVKKLDNYSNFNGLIDEFDNINYCKTYVSLINDEFSLFCAKEQNFQKYFQLIPYERYKDSGIVPDMSNLLNLCSKLYYCALEQEILKLHKYQEELNDLQNKIYDIKLDIGKVQRGIKYAFLYLYNNIISDSIEHNYLVSPKFQRELDDITIERINATINFLINQKYIYKLYSLGKKQIYQLNDVIEIFSDINVLSDQGKIKKVVGPYTANINTIYRVNFEKSNLIFRFRTSEYYRSEDMIKEKIIFPLLDRTLNNSISNFREKVKPIINSNKGIYKFAESKPSIIPVSNILYYDETKEKIPYNFSIQKYIHGKSLDQIISEDSMNLSKSKYLKLFYNIGDILGKLHSIEFNSFQENIYDIGKKSSKNWLDIFNSELNLEIQELKRSKLNIEKEILTYYKDHQNLLLNEDTPVLIHNDYQATNIIVGKESGNIQINGIIDFDDWRIGVKSQDFVKIYSLNFNTQKNIEIKKSFLDGYKTHHNLSKEFDEKVEIYTVFWLLKLLNYKLIIKRETEQVKLSQKLSLEIENHLNELNRLIAN